MYKYSIRDFRKEFPDEKACLDYIFKQKHPDKVKTHYYVSGRKCYADTKGRQIHPVKGTIFEKSSTPLTLWFFAIYLFSVSRNGVSAKELQRQLGVTYKTAWRMGKQIRALMKQGRRFEEVLAVLRGRVRFPAERPPCCFFGDDGEDIAAPSS